MLVPASWLVPQGWQEAGKKEKTQACQGEAREVASQRITCLGEADQEGGEGKEQAGD